MLNFKTRITSFVSSYPDTIESVFEQVLLVCDQQGLKPISVIKLMKSA